MHLDVDSLYPTIIKIIVAPCISSSGATKAHCGPRTQSYGMILKLHRIYLVRSVLVALSECSLYTNQRLKLSHQLCPTVREVIYVNFIINFVIVILSV